MNLLSYTKKLAEQIAYYDEIAKIDFFKEANPFVQPINITIIWVEDNQ